MLIGLEKLESLDTEKDDGAHAVYSASGSERWLNCPGSIKLAEKAPPEIESEYAKEGTRAHACLEFLLNNRNSLKAALGAARKFFDTDMIQHAMDAMQWVLERQAALPESILQAEQKVDSSAFTMAGQFGTLDVAIIQEWGTLVIIDYKYGAGIAVDPEENSQLIYYALAVAQQFSFAFLKVELTVIQPRAHHESGNTIRTAVMTMSELKRWRQRFKDGVKRTKDPVAAYQAGKWCRFCRAAPLCPEIKDSAMRRAQVVFSDTVGIESVPEPTMIQIPNLGTILEACDRLEDWIARVREHAHHVMTKGEAVAGFKLVQKRAQRKWKDEDAAAADAKKTFGTSAFSKPELLSPAQLEKKVTNPALKIENWVAERTTAISSGTTIALESDKRPAVTSAVAVFTANPLLPAKGKR